MEQNIESLIALAHEKGYSANDSTQFVLLLGENLARSSAYKIFNAAFQATCRNVLYLSCETSAAELPARLSWIRKEPRLLGFTATTPHKTTVIKYLDEVAFEGRICEAANSVVRRHDGTLWGTSYDGAGWVHWFTKHLHRDLHQRFLILGAGGAARSMAAAILHTEPRAKISVYDIDTSLAQNLSASLKAHLNADVRAVNSSQLNAEIERAEIVANFTGLGKAHYEEHPDIDFSRLAGKVAVDANYQPYPMTSFLELAQNSGAQIYNGLGFLVGTIPPFFKALVGEDVEFENLLAFAKNELGLKEADESSSTAVASHG